MKSAVGTADWIRCIFASEIYKPNQGRLVRLITFIGLFLAASLVSWSVAAAITETNAEAIAFGCALVAGWLAWRAINYEPLAVFLIEVQVELTKVHWITFAQLRRATVVVLAIMLTLVLFIFLCDFFWQGILQLLGILKVR